MDSDVIKCFVCGAVGDSLVPVYKEGFKPDEKENWTQGVGFITKEMLKE